MTPQFTTKPPEPYKLPDAQRKKLSKFLRKHFSGKEQTPDFQNRFWNKLKGARDWVNRFWPITVAAMLLSGCAPVLGEKGNNPSPLSVASITPTPPTTKKQNFSGPSVVANRPPTNPNGIRPQFGNRLYELHFTTCGTPLTPPPEIGSGYIADPLNYYPLNRDNLEGIGFDKRPKKIYVSHDLITWTLAMSNSMAAFFYTDNAPCCFFRVGQNKPSNVSVDELCNITIIARSF